MTIEVTIARGENNLKPKPDVDDTLAAPAPTTSSSKDNSKKTAEDKEREVPPISPVSVSSPSLSSQDPDKDGNEDSDQENEEESGAAHQQQLSAIKRKRNKKLGSLCPTTVFKTISSNSFATKQRGRGTTPTTTNSSNISRAKSLSRVSNNKTLLHKGRTQKNQSTVSTEEKPRSSSVPKSPSGLKSEQARQIVYSKEFQHNKFFQQAMRAAEIGLQSLSLFDGNKNSNNKSESPMKALDSPTASSNNSAAAPSPKVLQTQSNGSTNGTPSNAKAEPKEMKLVDSGRKTSTESPGSLLLQQSSEGSSSSAANGGVGALGKDPLAIPLLYGSNYYISQSSKRTKGSKRPIVIDGSNVAMGHGNHQMFSCLGIKICSSFFTSRGHAVVAFVPQFRRKASPQTLNRFILEELASSGIAKFTPSREVGGERFCSYDDRYIVQYAAASGGIIVSNDNYRDLYDEEPLWRETIRSRILQYTWVSANFIMFPPDPLGRSGSNLDEFLKF